MIHNTMEEKTVDNQSLIEAVKMLVHSDDAELLYESLLVVSRLPTNLLVGLTGEAEELYPLVHVKRADPDRFDQYMERVNRYRRQRLKAPLGGPNKGFDKGEYQRAFMDQKRQRQRRAAELENAQRSERDQLIGNARLDFMREQSKRWKVRRDEMMVSAREAAGGTLTKEQQTRVLGSFWASVDAELDELEVAVRRRGLGL